MRKPGPPRPPRRKQADAELARLAERIRRTNPTGRGLPAAVELARYAEKAQLQSSAIERYPDLISAVFDRVTPGVVLLEVPSLGLSLCHAVVAELSCAARDRIVQLDEAERADDRRRHEPRSRGDIDDRVGDEAPALEEEVQRLARAYDYAGALETLFAKRQTTPAPTWTELFLFVSVQTLGDVATASSARLDSSAAVSPEAKLAMARVRLFECKPREALELAAPLLDRADVGLVRDLVTAILSADDVSLESMLEDRLLVARGDGCETIAPLRSRKAERCRRLREELDALGSDPECPACRDIALAIGRLAPSDGVARELLAEGQRRHRERHLRAELALVDDHIVQGRLDAARSLYEDVRSRSRRIDALRTELEDVERRVGEAESQAVARAARLIVAETVRNVRLSAVAGASPEVRAACVLLAPDLARFVGLSEVLPVHEAIAIEVALEDIDALPSPEAKLARLSAFRHHANKAPALGARLRELERAIASTLDETAEILDGELAVLLDEAWLDEARRLVGAVREVGLQLITERAIALDTILERIASARRVARLPTRSLRLDAAHRLHPRARTLLRGVLRDDWRREHSSTYTPSHARVVIAGGQPIVAFCDGPHLVVRSETTTLAFELDEPAALAELVQTSGSLFAFTRRGELLALDARTLEPTLHRRLDGNVSGARMLPSGEAVVFDETLAELRLHRTSGQVIRTRTAHLCRFDDDGGRVAVAAGDAIVVTSYDLDVVEEYPAAEYSLLGLGSHPRDGVTVYALRQRETGETSLSFRHGRTFVTEWIDDADDWESVTFDSRGGSLSLLFSGAVSSARKYLPFDLGLLEIGRHTFASTLVAHTGGGRLVEVATDDSDASGGLIARVALIGETTSRTGEAP